MLFQERQKGHAVPREAEGHAVPRGRKERVSWSGRSLTGGHTWQWGWWGGEAGGRREEGGGRKGNWWCLKRRCTTNTVKPIMMSVYFITRNLINSEHVHRSLEILRQCCHFYFTNIPRWTKNIRTLHKKIIRTFLRPCEDAWVVPVAQLVVINSCFIRRNTVD